MIVFAALIAAISAMYLIIVAFCVSCRMSGATSHTVRCIVISLGGTGVFCLFKILDGPAIILSDLAFFGATAIIAIATWLAPRIPTGEEVKHVSD